MFCSEILGSLEHTIKSNVYCQIELKNEEKLKSLGIVQGRKS